MPDPSRYGPFGLRPLGELLRKDEPGSHLSALTDREAWDLEVLLERASRGSDPAHRSRCRAVGVDPDHVATIDLRDPRWGAGAGGWGSSALGRLLGYELPSGRCNTKTIKARVEAWRAARLVDVRSKVVWIFHRELVPTASATERAAARFWRWSDEGARRAPARDPSGIDPSGIACLSYIGQAAVAPGIRATPPGELAPARAAITPPAPIAAAPSDPDPLDELVNLFAGVKPGYVPTPANRISIAHLVERFGVDAVRAALLSAGQVRDPMPWLISAVEGRAADARHAARREREQAEETARRSAAAEQERREREAPETALEARLRNSIPDYEGIPRIQRFDPESRRLLAALVAQYGEAKAWEAAALVASYRTPIQGLADILADMHSPKSPARQDRGRKKKLRLETAQAEQARADAREERARAQAQRAEAQRQLLAALLVGVERRPPSRATWASLEAERTRSESRRDAAECWERAVERIRGQVADENYETYFAPLRFVRGDASTVVLGVVDPFFGDWVVLHYQDLLEEACEGRAVLLEVVDWRAVDEVVDKALADGAHGAEEVAA